LAKVSDRIRRGAIGDIGAKGGPMAQMLMHPNGAIGDHHSPLVVIGAN
jgi:hypothetical protein